MLPDGPQIETGLLNKLWQFVNLRCISKAVGESVVGGCNNTATIVGVEMQED